MGGSVRRGYGVGSKPEPEYNIVQDVKAAQVVFRSGVPLVVAPLDATAMLKLDTARQKRLYDAGSLLTLSVQALVQLWQDKNLPILFDPVAVTLVYTEKFCTMRDLALEVDDKGFTKIVEAGKAERARGDRDQEGRVPRLDRRSTGESVSQVAAVRARRQRNEDGPARQDAEPRPRLRGLRNRYRKTLVAGQPAGSPRRSVSWI